MTKKKSEKKKAELMTIREGILYKEDGSPVTAGNADAPYCNAYRELFAELRHWPPDGEYAYNGKTMKPA